MSARFWANARTCFSRRQSGVFAREILDQTRSGGWRGEVLHRRKDGTECPNFSKHLANQGTRRAA